MSCSSLQDIRILIAEDDPNSAKLLTGFLRVKGVGCIRHVSDGIEAIDLAEKEHFDVAIVDLRLPGENGFMVTECIRKTAAPSATAIVVVSAFADKQNQLRAFESGASAFFSKPVDLKELLLMIRNFAVQKQTSASQALHTLEQLNRMGEAKLGRVGHARRTQQLCQELAGVAGIGGAALELLLQAAALHDVCLVYDTPETPHGALAADLVARFGLSAELAQLVRLHHNGAVQPFDERLRPLLRILQQAEQITERNEA